VLRISRGQSIFGASVPASNSSMRTAEDQEYGYENDSRRKSRSPESAELQNEPNFRWGME
jgi:hypothetical protein